MSEDIIGGVPSRTQTLIIGGGPAGLTTAYELKRLDDNMDVTVFEADERPGGISRTEKYKGFGIDIGGHRFFTKVPEVNAMWKEVLGDDFIKVPRMSRIYYRGKYYHYPLRIYNALSNIGIYETVRIMLSYAKWKIRPHKKEESFEEWVINRFGGRLYMHFFRSYTEKVWGISPKQIQADWAAQRIKNLSLTKAVWNALTGSNNTTSLIDKFEYPRQGPGMMWEKTVDRIREKNGQVHMKSYVKKLERDGNRVTAAVVENAEGTHRVEAEHFVNSMDMRTLIHSFDPPPPQEIIDAANTLRFRDFLIVGLILNKPDPFPDNWIYIHSGDVQVGRIQNFRAWSREMVPNDEQSSIGMEYFCNVTDPIWNEDDADLIEMAGKELEQLGLGSSDDVADGVVIRQPKAYPVYDTEYKAAVDTIHTWLETLENFATIGRNGQHRYNNQDHSMLTGMYAARNILGAHYDLWQVNVERAYHEEMQRDASSSAQAREAVEA
ncbi:MAG: NAD(P)/FAD-dependent oxidoreductase [Silicimonas sp.]